MANYASVNLREPSEASSLAPHRFKDSESPMVVDRTLVRPGIGVWTPLCIIGGLAAAAVLAILHHVFDTHFNGRVVSGFWTQTKTSQIEILLATAFKILFCFSAGVSLCQVAWHSMRRQPLPLADIDHLLGGPSIMMFPRLNLLFQAPATLAITATILASSLITVFAPSLTVRQATAINRSITVPTLELSTDAWLDDMNIQQDSYSSPSRTWDKIVLTGLTSESPVGWTIPDGCAPECQYNISYFAPALRCSDLTPDQIDDGATDGLRVVPRVFQNPPGAYLRDYDTIVAGAIVNGVLNFTSEGYPSELTSVNNQYTWTFAYLPFDASNANDGALINAAGTTCTLYNATHAAQTHFANGTQTSSVSVVEFHDALNTSRRHPGHLFNENGDNDLPLVGGVGVGFAPGLGAPLHFIALADAITARLVGAVVANFQGDIQSLDPDTISLALETNLFEPLAPFNATTRFLGLSVSPSITNMSQALEDMVANITLSFVHLGTGFTTVDVVVPSTDTVYEYNRTTLGATYLVAFACLLAVSALGMFCLMANGEPSSNSFSQLLLATQNARLYPVADKIEADPALSEKSTDSIRLMYGEVDVPGRGVKAAFGLVSDQKVETLRRRR
ncbi:hypothetical protein B0H17DRAFT_1042976 [Mycena rosella]|uniref:Uncharacterized protein n=1 Tax=Mycena rosella TaxID=1033263 RepID=A0AAD7E189_MYCRO|nr:hypothetical protein B0H17DRAFT_1042976 [Mycena rosella]